LRKLVKLDYAIEGLKNLAEKVQTITVFANENGSLERPNLPGYNYFVDINRKYKSIFVESEFRKILVLKKVVYKVYTFKNKSDLLNFENFISDHIHTRIFLGREFNCSNFYILKKLK
jgi:hypothetical protein